MDNAPAGIPDLGVSTIGVKLLWVQSIVKCGSGVAGTTRPCGGIRACVLAVERRSAVDEETARSDSAVDWNDW